jgi:hypothetical protein
MRIFIFTSFLSIFQLALGQAVYLDFKSSIFNALSNVKYPLKPSSLYLVQHELSLRAEFFTRDKYHFDLGLYYGRAFSSHELIGIEGNASYKLGRRPQELRVDVRVPILYNRFRSDLKTLNKIDAEIGVGYKWYLNGRLYAYPMVGVLFLKDKGSSFPYDAFDPHTVVRPNFKLGIGYRFGKKDKQE